MALEIKIAPLVAELGCHPGRRQAPGGHGSGPKRSLGTGLRSWAEGWWRRMGGLGSVGRTETKKVEGEEGAGGMKEVGKKRREI